MPTSSAVRIDDDVHASAKAVAPAMSRSVAQQIAHWARIGRELETSPTVSQAQIGEVLSGARSYDNLDAHAQAIVRAEWTEAMEQRRRTLDLAADFQSSGRSFVELDGDGKVVTRQANQDSDS